MTNQELIEAWDRGESITAVSMGGMGPGYESAIWAIAIRMLEYLEKNPFKYDLLEDETMINTAKKTWLEYCDEMDEELLSIPEVKEIGPSGAQWGAARNVASVINRQGYDKALTMVSPERIIQVAKV